MASDFLSNYVFLAVGRVGSSTDLIVQRVEYVLDSDKRSHLMDLLHAQRADGTHGKVLNLFKNQTVEFVCEYIKNHLYIQVIVQRYDFHCYLWGCFLSCSNL